ncbi:hypothetical protein GP486_003202 [Trichoglossum hirsutum]|uniref:Uncharacterized protein n=1 Tax=Trichoglossum hirsutum TaxID=265104 RepID=A0A9P8RQY8_9PEZI|nr:hypothetical protein GP486_003202 [Trichoglossum hirsutum]
MFSRPRSTNPLQDAERELSRISPAVPSPHDSVVDPQTTSIEGSNAQYRRSSESEESSETEEIFRPIGPSVDSLQDSLEQAERLLDTLLQPRRRQTLPINSKRRSPLSFAAYGAHLEIVKLLLDNGADVDHKANNEWTPLHLTTQFLRDKTLDTIKMLAKSGADINARTDANGTVLHIATQRGSTEIIQYLISDLEHRRISLRAASLYLIAREERNCLQGLAVQPTSKKTARALSDNRTIKRGSQGADDVRAYLIDIWMNEPPAEEDQLTGLLINLRRLVILENLATLLSDTQHGEYEKRKLLGEGDYGMTKQSPGQPGQAI